MIPRILRTSHRARRGFTLVELLVTITVISILASLVYGAVTAAQKSARQTQTKTTIAKIHRIIMRKMADYRTRRVPEADYAKVGVTPNSLTRQQKAAVKVNCIRDLIRMEMPDRWTDVVSVAEWTNFRSSGALPTPGMESSPALLINSHPASSRYFYRKLYDAARDLPPADAYNLTNKFAAAELLYLIVMQNCENAEQFRSNEIGDFDGDGLMEFQDAWGHPIRFIRWPAGFIPANGAESAFQSGDPTKDNDPFDTLGVFNSVAYRLVPLIYSAGPDGIYDVNIGNQADSTTTSGYSTYAYRLESGVIDPYDHDDNTLFHATGEQIATPIDGPDAFTGATAGNKRLDDKDNIHNHQLGL